jgi:peptidoglycan/LPS O-acetylase OafA/YrhL
MNKRVLELDGLRAFAVFGVILFHMNGWSGAIPHTNKVVNAIIECFGPSGVLIFFVISGFIITTLLLREQEKTGEVSLKAFYVRRFLRIVPPLAFYLLGLSALSALGYISVNPVNYVYSLLFVTNWGFLTGPGISFLDHTWTLSIEEQYYIFLPPILVLGLTFRKKPITLLLVILFCFCLTSLTLATRLSKINHSLLRLATFYKFRFIIVGVLLALYRNLVTSLLAARSILFPILALVFIFCNYYFKLPSPFNLVMSGIEAVVWGLFVMWFVENPEKCGMLRWSVIQWLGTISYSLYLWQQLFTCSPDQYPAWTFTRSPLAFIPILVCATASYYLIEKPTIRMGRWLSKRMETPEFALKRST